MNRFTYATLLTSDDYLPGVALLKASLEKVHTEYPLLVMTTGNLSDITLHELQKLDVVIKEVPQIHIARLEEHNKTINPSLATVWADVLAKLNVWKFTEYNKIIMCDCDLMFLKNVDHCFDFPNMTAALDGEYFNLWPNQPHFNSGFFVLEPDIHIFNDILSFAENLDPAPLRDYFGRPYVIADQEILNIFYKDWQEHSELHLNKYYNVFAPHIHKACLQDILSNAYFIHFTGSKPWVTLSDAVPICDDWIPEYPYALARALLRIYEENAQILPGRAGGLIREEAINQLLTYYVNFEEAYRVSQVEKLPDDLKLRVKRLYEKEQLFKLMLPLLKKTYEDRALAGNTTVEAYSKMHFWEDYDRLLFEERLIVLDEVQDIYNKLNTYIYDEG